MNKLFFLAGFGIFALASRIQAPHLQETEFPQIEREVAEIHHFPSSPVVETRAKAAPKVQRAVPVVKRTWTCESEKLGEGRLATSGGTFRVPGSEGTVRVCSWR